MLRRLLILLAILLAPALANARGIEPQLIAENSAQPGGEVELAIRMNTQPGWHGYWLNPGDAGLPMEVKWELPPGYAVGALRYPVPTRLTVAGIMNYVYENDYSVLARLKVPADAKPGTVPIRASARWLACTDKICVPEQGEFSTDLAIGKVQPDFQEQFDAWRKLLPRPLATPANFEVSGQKLRIAIPLPRNVEVKEPYVFAAVDGPVDYAAEQQFRRKGDRLIAGLPRRTGEPAQFAGVLSLGDGTGLEFTAVRGTVPKGGSLIGDTGPQAILWAVVGAILGGLLLNLMPCVFPILAIKALHLAKSGGDERAARRDALGYAAGAIVGTGALGVVLLAIRSAGTEIGWAFQLQDPRTILILLLLTTAITLNLLRVFEVPSVMTESMPSGSFGAGALAAFVATPCAGPFLGVALGAALLLPPAGSIAVFAALGLGLALPFVLVAFIPALRKLLPKPGAWMATLQRILAIPMGLTALACLWLLWRLGGGTALQIGIAAAVLVSVMLFGAGLLQRQGKQSGYLATLAAIAVAVVAIAFIPIAPPTASTAASDASAWSEARVEEQLAAGHPVFVYFTADWCLTCKANETAAINRDEVQKAFEKAGVTVLVGDWTKGDPEITRFLESRGRAGVPLYLWYVPGKDPEELPQILTPSMLISRARQSR
ncbi:thioredoxin family protein [Sphingomonas daechungensis]|uniref:protein-disulfide reductase DsbD family protein n=1 Tax=Sphingomonas daechungensis TaxID=1176646 RepID=UPI0031F19871